MESEDLDETLKMEGRATAASAAAEQWIKDHAEEVEAFRQQIEGLKKPGAALIDLRKLVAEASRMRDLLPLISREKLEASGVPVHELEKAGEVLAVVDALEFAGAALHSTLKLLLVQLLVLVR